MKISEVKIGYIFEAKNQRAMITKRTKNSLTATFENGNVVKLTYKNDDCYFYAADF